MTERRRWFFTCDHPDCDATLIVTEREGYWNSQAAQAAENRGWLVRATVTYCPDHDPMMAALRED